MTEAERLELVQSLQESEQALIARLEPLTDEQWRFKPAPDQWSIAEIAEHVALADALFLGLVRSLVNGEPDPEWASMGRKSAILRTAIPDRTSRVVAPARLQPRGEMSRGEVMGRLRGARAELVTFAQTTTAPLHTFTAKNPFFGRLSGYQWLMYSPLHQRRHEQQIAEVQAHAAFPQAQGPRPKAQGLRPKA